MDHSSIINMKKACTGLQWLMDLSHETISHVEKEYLNIDNVVALCMFFRKLYRHIPSMSSLGPWEVQAKGQREEEWLCSSKPAPSMAKRQLRHALCSLGEYTKTPKR